MELYMFSAKFCPTCRVVKTGAWNHATNLFKDVGFHYIDVEEEDTLAEIYEVSTLPAFILMKDNKEVARKTGLITSAEMTRWIEEHKE